MHDLVNKTWLPEKVKGSDKSNITNSCHDMRHKVTEECF